MTLTPAMQTAFDAERVIAVLLIEALLPDHPMRLMFGVGSIAWGGVSFSDYDATYGLLAAIDAIEDGDDDEAQPFTFTMIPASDAAAAALCSPTLQGSTVNVWLGAQSPTTGLLVPDPELLGTFLWDIGTLTPDVGTREVEIECVGQDALLLEDDEGARLTDAFHQSIYPGETGLANVTGLTETRYWGMATPRNTGTYVLPSNTTIDLSNLSIV